MKLPFRKSHLFSRTTRRNHDQEQSEKDMAYHRAQGTTPEQLRVREESFPEYVPLTPEEEESIRNDYSIFEHGAREDAIRMAREQGILEPKMPDPADCESSFIHFAAGVGISAAAGAGIGSIGGPQAAAFGGITAGLASGLRDAWDDSVKRRQCTKEQAEKYEQDFQAYEEKLKELNPNYGRPVTYWFEQRSKQKAEDMQRENTYVSSNMAQAPAQPTFDFSTNGKIHRIKIGVRY